MDVDARKVKLPIPMFVGALFLIVGPIVWTATEIRATRLLAGAASIRLEDIEEDLHRRLAELPTTEQVELIAIRAVRPLETAVAGMSAQLKYLSTRVGQLENKDE